MTRRNSGKDSGQHIADSTRCCVASINYFRVNQNCYAGNEAVDGVATQRLRCVQLKQWKTHAPAPATEQLGLRPPFQFIRMQIGAMRRKSTGKLRNGPIVVARTNWADRLSTESRLCVPVNLDKCFYMSVYEARTSVRRGNGADASP